MSHLLNDLMYRSMATDSAENAAKEVRNQLRGRTGKGSVGTRFYNRNLFQVKTSDKDAEKLRDYCEEHQLVPNQLLNKLISTFLQDNA